MRKIILGFLAALMLQSAALAQQGTQFAPGQIYGNDTSSTRNGRAASVSAILDRALGSTRGAIIERGASGWAMVGPSATAGLAWISAGTGADPAYGILGLSGGGCGAALTASNGGVLYSTATNCAILPGNITTTKQYLSQTGTGSASAAPAWATIAGADITGAALTAANDTNVTLTLGGTPATSLLRAASITAGWTGTLAAARLNSNVVQAVTNDTNVTGSISAQNLTLGWTGTVSVARGGTGIGSGTSGGIPYFSSGSTIASSGVLTANRLVLGGGAGIAPTVAGSLGTTTTVLHGNAAGAPTFGPVALGTDVSGQLSIANGGTGQSSQSAALAALLPTPTRAGDVLYYNGTSWVLLPGNNSGTQFLSQNASGVPSWASAGGTGTVTSVTCGTGLDGGTITSTGTCSLSAARQTLPSITQLTSGSGTYTTPTNALWLEVRLVGGGGGGGGGNSATASGGGGATCWNTSGTACTTPLYQASGGGGASFGGGGVGGGVAGALSCDWSVSGGSGSSGVPGTTAGGTPGGIGGNSSLGGAGGVNVASTGSSAAASSGSGGGGGGITTGVVANSGSGGGAGGTCVAIIGTPASTYTYTVGAGGGGASGGTNGASGGNGGSGKIVVIAHFGT